LSKKVWTNLCQTS